MTKLTVQQGTKNKSKKRWLLLLVASPILAIFGGMLLAPMIGGIALMALTTSTSLMALGAAAVAGNLYSLASAAKRVVKTISSKKKTLSLGHRFVWLAMSGVNLGTGIALFGALAPLGMFGTVVLGASAIYLGISGAIGIIAVPVSLAVAVLAPALRSKKATTAVATVASKLDVAPSKLNISVQPAFTAAANDAAPAEKTAAPAPNAAPKPPRAA